MLSGLLSPLARSDLCEPATIWVSGDFSMLLYCQNDFFFFFLLSETLVSSRCDRYTHSPLSYWRQISWQVTAVTPLYSLKIFLFFFCYHFFILFFFFFFFFVDHYECHFSYNASIMQRLDGNLHVHPPSSTPKSEFFSHSFGIQFYS